MTATIDLDQLLATIAHEARVALDTAECAIDAYDPDADTITIVAFEQRTPEPGWERWVGREYSPGRVRVRPAATSTAAMSSKKQISDPGMDERNRAPTCRTARRAS